MSDEKHKLLCELWIIDIMIAAKEFTIGSLLLLCHRYSQQVCYIRPHGDQH